MKTEVDGKICECQKTTSGSPKLINKDWKKPLYCGDGFSGRPGQNWWCLADSVLEGQPRIGHGRGMSQVGSKIWAKHGKPWSWILWHYYQEKRHMPQLPISNNNDPTPYATISSPINVNPQLDLNYATSQKNPSLEWFQGNINLHWMVENSNSDALRIGPGSVSGLLLRLMQNTEPQTLLTPIDSKVLTLKTGTHDLVQSFKPATSNTAGYQAELWLDVNETGAVEIESDLLLGQADPERFTHIANDGSLLPVSAYLRGDGAKDWGCNLDNATGLMWEVKTTDGGLREAAWSYLSYDPVYAADDVYDPATGWLSNVGADRIWGGVINPDAAPYGSTGKSQGLCKANPAQCTTYAYSMAVNQQNLCGHNDWRIPTKDEIASVGTAGYRNVQANFTDSADDSTIWSSSPNASNPYQAWAGAISSVGNESSKQRDYALPVRLVRGGK